MYQFNITVAEVKYERITPSAETCIHTCVMQSNQQFAVESLKYPKSFELTKDDFCLTVFIFPSLLNKVQLITCRD